MKTELDKLRNELLRNKLDYLGKQYRMHKDYCINYLVQKKGCEVADAEDIFSESILVLRSKIINRQLDNLNNLRSYLTGICINIYRSDKRKERGIKNREYKVKALLKSQEHASFHQDYSDEFLSEMCRNSLRRLGSRCGELLKLFYYEKIPLKDIAELMQFSTVASVKSTKTICFRKWVEETKLLIQKHR